MTTAVREALDLAFDVEGDGAAIVFIPGANDDRNGWAEVAPAFAEYKRVTFDNRDVGQSPRAAGPYTVADMAADTLRMMDRAGIERAHILGHSMGGAIAQELALQAPERVTSLVLIGTFAEPDPYLTAAASQWQHWIRTLDADAFLRNTLFFWVGPAIINDMGMDALVELVAPQVIAQGPEAFCRQVDAALAHDTADRLGQINAPALVVAGEDDMIVRPNHDQQLLAGIRGARYIRIPNSGHSPTIEQPEVLNAEIREFLKSL